jgi:YhcH/YjgK/YiaL family protein
MKEEMMAYSDEKDAALWKLTAYTTPLHVSAGHFAILWPEDAHAPCIEWEKPEQVFKVVIKVVVE